MGLPRGRRVFKPNKPVRYPFFDFSTLELRKHFVAEEVRLNRRLAPDVYLGMRRIEPVAWSEEE